MELVANQIAAGGYPADELATSVRELSAHADGALRAGDLPAVAGMVVQAIEAVLSRELHADVLESPLVTDPVGFLAPLRESLTFRALRAPAGSMAGVLADPDSPERTSVPAAASPPPRLPGSPAPHRVLVVPGDYPTSPRASSARWPRNQTSNYESSTCASPASRGATSAPR